MTPRKSPHIGYGTIWEYTWRFVRLLVHLARRYILWPSLQQRWQLPAPGPLNPRRELFAGCVGFLDGSETPLQSKPKYDQRLTSHVRKYMASTCKLSATWSGRFTYASTGYTASIHDSTAFKNCTLYSERSTYIPNGEYLLADKADQLDRHVITPYKEPVSRQRSHASFN